MDCLVYSLGAGGSPPVVGGVYVAGDGLQVDTVLRVVFDVV